MSAKAIWTAIQAGFTGVGAWFGAWVGGLDGLVYALIAFTIADYITGVLAAITERRVNSAIGFTGIFRKVVIFTLIGLAHLLDTHVLGTPGVLRTAVIFFYLSNEGISLLENATRLGLPVPPPIRDALDVIANHTNERPPLSDPEPAGVPETSASTPTQPKTASTHREGEQQ